MTQYEITFLPENVTVPARADEILLDVAARANLHINASCGGEGVCGRCRVKLAEGELSAEPGLYLTEEDFAAGLRLACRAKIKGPATIEIPLESRADASLFTRYTAEAEDEIQLERLEPLVRQLMVKIAPPTVEDNQNDYERILDTLAAGHGLEDPDMDLAALRDLPGLLRRTEFNVSARVFFDYHKSSRIQSRILSVKPIRDGRKNYGLAVDIGTTTVWARLLDLDSGRTIQSFGDLNGQISFGEDVISRIVYAGKQDGLKRLQEKVVENLNHLLDRLEQEVPGCRQDISLMVVAGNTTMSHLFMGLDPKSIRLAPYVPAAAVWPVVRAHELGLKLPDWTVLLNFPAVSSYVGGDIVAGVLASELYRRPELTLFIDVGTNGEIVVGNCDFMTCAACSAGPAFEGGGVKFGMRAAPGAIDGFHFDRNSGRHLLQVIDNEAPVGICGSGLINIVAGLFRGGVLDPRGKFIRSASPNIRAGEDGQEYLLCPAAKTATGRDLVLTEIDVDNLIRAKGALFSGYQTLLESVGLTMGDLSRVIIAGGFGRSLNIKNAVTIGLLPELPLNRFTYIGNSSLTGATLAALSGELWRTARQIKRGLTNFELSETPGYMDYYVASQFLPHTRRDLFPETMEELSRKEEPPLSSRTRK